MSASPETIRLDKWLWHARFFKSRSLASKTISSGGVRVNSEKVDKPSRQISKDDVLTFTQGKQIRVVKVLGPGKRRGPATESVELYEDMSPSPDQPVKRVGPRPTKKERRVLDASRQSPLD